MHADDDWQFSGVDFTYMETECFLAFRRFRNVVFDRNSLTYACKQKVFNTNFYSSIFAYLSRVGRRVYGHRFFLFGPFILVGQSVSSFHFGVRRIRFLGSSDDRRFHCQKWLEDLGNLYPSHYRFFYYSFSTPSFLTKTNE